VRVIELEHYAALSISLSLHFSIDSVSKGNHNLLSRNFLMHGATYFRLQVVMLLVR